MCTYPGGRGLRSVNTIYIKQAQHKNINLNRLRKRLTAAKFLLHRCYVKANGMFWFLMLFSAALGAAITEDIYIEEISKPKYRRNAEPSPQDEIVLNIVRRNGDVHTLHLRENKAINVNAPVYEAKFENGKHRAVLKREEPIEGVQYYYDIDKKAAFQVTCTPGPRGEPLCLREVEGVMDIDGELYEVKPKERRLIARGSGDRKRHPHLMKKAEMKNILFDDINENIERKALPENKLSGSRYKKQEPTLYTVEVVVALDHPLWALFVTRVKNKYGTSDEAVVEKEARRYYTTLVHLASLAYEGINSQEFTIKIVISGFLFFKEETQKMIDENVYNEDGTHTEGVHFGEFLSGMYKEMRENNQLPNADHVYTFTLHGTQGAAGANCLGCVCETRGWGWSTSDADELSYETRLFAHEIGHGLGLSHISKDRHKDVGIDCGEPSDGYVMGSDVIGRYWEFSNCSIYELKLYLGGTGQQCLLDSADVYNIEEWNEYTNKMPGQIRNITEQCIDMNNGKKVLNEETESVLCNAVTDEYFCYDMSCAGEDGCKKPIAAADGTPCGLPSQHKWCSASACVQMPGETTTTSTTGDAENCYNTYAETYLGTKSTAKSGYTCQRWDADYPHKHNQDTNDKFLDASVADAANYCRDPTVRGKPWCYLDQRWDFCDVPKCSAEKVNTCAEANKQYQRTLNKTRGGIPCQAWSSQSPHTHRFDSDSDFPGETIEEAGNFCRYIDNEDIAWCYTTDENKRWDYCETKTCEDDSCYGDLIEYTGDVNVTSGGIPCQRWNSNSPINNYYLNAAEGNACRKLDEPSPWCYLGKSWDYCDIPEC